MRPSVCDHAAVIKEDSIRVGQVRQLMMDMFFCTNNQQSDTRTIQEEGPSCPRETAFTSGVIIIQTCFAAFNKCSLQNKQ